MTKPSTKSVTHSRGRLRAVRGRPIALKEGAVATVVQSAHAGAEGRKAQGDAASRPRGLAALLETTKPRITRLVTITSMVGFVAAAVQRSWDLRDLIITALACAVGTACSAAGANAVNQYIERDRDALMPRTRTRPLPESRSSPSHVLAFGLGLAAAGVAILWSLCGMMPALVSLACFLIYVAIYTPLKPRTTLNTYVGTLPGALPPLIGWTAASSAVGFASLAEWGGLSLFMLMTVWQIPHFFAIAWLYRTDYALGGYRMVAVEDESGIRTARTVALWTFLLVPTTLAPYWLLDAVVGPVYFGVAAISGLAFAWLAAKFIRSRERTDARRLFIASVIHLPLILVTLVGEALARVAIAKWM